MLTRKELLLQHTNRNDIIMRKLKITELNRISIEEFKEADKLPLVVVLQNSLLCVRWKSPIQVENRKRDSSDSFGLLVLTQQLE